MESKERSPSSCLPSRHAKAFCADDGMLTKAAPLEEARKCGTEKTAWHTLRWMLFLPAAFGMLGSTFFPISFLRHQKWPRRLAETPAQTDVPRLQTQHMTVADDDDFYSTAHCVGENFGKDSWKYKSCQFRNFCFDTQSNDYVLFPSKDEIELHRMLSRRPDDFASSSTVMNDNSVSLGTLTSKWATQQSALRWFPRIETDRSELDARGVYMLPDDIALVPFHSFQSAHPGHLVWDDWFPIFLLASMFGLDDKQLVLVRHVLDQPLPKTCDSSADGARTCQSNFQKYQSLLGISNDTYLMASNVFSVGGSLSPYVCAKFGAAGLGMVANHIRKQSDWKADDYKLTHSVGYGALMWNFRMFMADKLARDGKPLASKMSPGAITITFALSASSTELERAVAPTAKLFAPSSYQVQSYQFERLDVKTQARIISQSDILITDCTGEGLLSAVFLPRRASLFLYCPINAADTLSAHIKWGLLNHAGYFRTNWLKGNDLDTRLSSLIQTATVLLDKQVIA